MSLLQVPDEVMLCQRSLAEHKDYSDYVYSFMDDPATGWKPSQWVDFLDRIDYLPGWTAQVFVEPGATGSIVVLRFASPGGYEWKVFVGRHQVRTEQHARQVVEYALMKLHEGIHDQAFQVRTGV